MAIVTGLTADYMMELYGESIMSARLSGYNLILTTRDGVDIDVGSVRGVAGPTGPTGFTSVKVTAVVDFNSYVAPGTYLMVSNTSMAASTNAPAYPGFISGQAGFLLVEGDGSGYVKQTWTNHNNSAETLIRTRAYDTWISAGAWTPPVEGATANQPGILYLASAAEVTAGSNAVKAVTPSTLKGMSGYRLLQRVYFSSSGTFTKASYPDLKAIRVAAIGGGGGGGGATSAAGGQHSAGAGGGGGGYAEAFILAAALGTSETITIGAGGSAGSSSGGIGGIGGSSTLGAKVSALGGAGGESFSSNALMIGALGGAGGVGFIGDLKTSGGPGHMGTGYGTLGQGGAGGSSLGGGGLGVYLGAGSGTLPGNPGNPYGGGGGGATVNASGSGTAGGAGGAGLIIVEVYI